MQKAVGPFLNQACMDRDEEEFAVSTPWCQLTLAWNLQEVSDDALRVRLQWEPADRPSPSLYLPEAEDAQREQGRSVRCGHLWYVPYFELIHFNIVGILFNSVVILFNTVAILFILYVTPFTAVCPLALHWGGGPWHDIWRNSYRNMFLKQGAIKRNDSPHQSRMPLPARRAMEYRRAPTCHYRLVH
jgi:hypothetical protein